MTVLLVQLPAVMLILIYAIRGDIYRIQIFCRVYNFFLTLANWFYDFIIQIQKAKPLEE